MLHSESYTIATLHSCPVVVSGLVGDQVRVTRRAVWPESGRPSPHGRAATKTPLSNTVADKSLATVSDIRNDNRKLANAFGVFSPTGPRNIDAGFAQNRTPAVRHMQRYSRDVLAVDQLYVVLPGFTGRLDSAPPPAKTRIKRNNYLQPITPNF